MDIKKNTLHPIHKEDVLVGYYFDCPGCGFAHAPYLKPYENDVGASWFFNGDLKSPTFKPSLRTRVVRSDGKELICHIIVQDGTIHFLDDCTHHLAGQSLAFEWVEESDNNN